MWSGGLIGFVIAFAIVSYLISPAGMLSIKIVLSRISCYWGV
jgi:hypothetical protein